MQENCTRLYVDMKKDLDCVIVAMPDIKHPQVMPSPSHTCTRDMLAMFSMLVMLSMLVMFSSSLLMCVAWESKMVALLLINILLTR